MEEKLGSKYVADTRMDLAKSYEESSPATPVFFILSPGVDPLKDMETLGESIFNESCSCTGERERVNIYRPNPAPIEDNGILGFDLNGAGLGPKFKNLKQNQNNVVL